MSVSMSYVTRESVPEDVKKSIQSEAQKLDSGHDWWCESICFFDNPRFPDRLCGDTKLFLMGYTTDTGDYIDVDVDEDNLMAASDALFIIDHLCRWSKEHGISWDVIVEGEKIGTIENGEAGKYLKEYFEEMKETSSIPPDEENIKKISEKYSSRFPSSDTEITQPLDSKSEKETDSEKPEEKEEQTPEPEKSWWKFW